MLKAIEFILYGIQGVQTLWLLALITSTLGVGAVWVFKLMREVITGIITKSHD